MRRKVWKVWKVIVRLGAIGVIFGLFADFINILQLLRLLQVEPPGAPVIFEDYPPNPLPDCLFTETFRAEAEPDFHLNWFDWATGIGPLEESAYDRAESRIWNTVEPGGQGSLQFAGGVGGASPGEASRASDEMPATQGLKLVQRRFYFDRHGYHALVVMGRPMDLHRTAHSGCEVDLERGRIEPLSTSRPFTCATLHDVIDTEVNRITGVHTAERCWLGYSYEINPQNLQVHFQEEYFIRNPEEEWSDGTVWEM